MKKLLSVLISFIIVLSFQFIHATSLENGSFETDWTFVDGDHAYGMVTINGIATLPQPDTYDQGNVYLDIFAGGVRNVIAADSTITLSNNLDIFGTINTNNSNVSFLKILGNDNTIGLSQNQTFSCLKVTGKDLVLDCFGNSLTLSGSRALRVAVGSELHIKNSTIYVANNSDALFLEAELSKLILEDCTLDLLCNCSIDKGSIEFRGNICIKSDASKAFILGGGNHVIKSDCTVSFYPGVSLNMTPSSSSEQFLTFEDDTAKLIFDGTTLTIDESVSGILSSGNIEMKNNCTTNTIKKTIVQELRDPSLIIGYPIDTMAWSKCGTFLAVGTAYMSDDGNSLKVYKFKDGVLSLLPGANVDFGWSVEDVAWSPDGNYLVVGGRQSSSSYEHEIKVYSFDGDSLSCDASIDYGSPPETLSYVYAVAWSPTGNYIAAGGRDSQDGNEIKVYSFNGTLLSLLSGANVDFGVRVRSIKWSANGNFLAVAGNATGANEIRVYSFDGVDLTLSDSNNYGPDGCEVFSVDWSPDGNFLLAGGTNPTDAGEVKVYNFDGSSLKHFSSYDSSYSNTAFSVSWSPDGSMFAVGGYELDDTSELKIYNFPWITFEEKTSAQIEFGEEVYESAWSPNGNYFAIGGIDESDNKEIQIYEFNGSDLILSASMQNDFNTILSLDWSHTGNYLAVGATYSTSKQELLVYNFCDGDLTITDSIELDSNGRFVRWHPNKMVLVVAGFNFLSPNHDFAVYELSNGSLVFKNSYNWFSGGPVSTLEWSLKSHADGNYYSISVADFIAISHCEEATDWGRPSDDANVSSLGSNVSGAAWSPDGSYTAVGFENGEIRVYEFTGSALNLKDTVDLGTSVTSVDWSSIGNFITVGGVPDSDNKQVQIYEFNLSSETLSLLSLTQKDFDGTVNKVEWHPSGDYMSVAGTGSPDVQIYDFNGNMLSEITDAQISFTHSYQTCFDISPDGNYVAVAYYKNDDDKKLQLYDSSNIDGGELTLISSSTINAVPWYVSWSPNGRYVLTAESNATTTAIHIYELSNTDFTEIESEEMPGAPASGSILQAEWSPDGGYIAVGRSVSPNVDIMLYSFNGESVTLTFSVELGGTNEIVYAINWSPDGNYLAVGGISFDFGDELEVYEFNKSEEKLTKKDGDSCGAIWALHWNPDSTYLAAGEYGGDQKTRLYSFNGTTLTYKGSFSVNGWDVVDMRWDPSGNYLIVGEDDDIKMCNYYMWELDRIKEKLVRISDVEIVLTATVGNLFDYGTVRWFPKGDKFALAGFRYDDLQVFNWYGTPKPQDSVHYGNRIYSVDWSSNNKIAIGGSTPSNGTELQVFDCQEKTLEEVSYFKLGSGQDYRASAWYENYFVTGENGAIQIYTFDGSSEELTLLTTESITNCDEIYSLDWTYSGSYLAAGVCDLSGTSSLHIYKFENDSLSLQDEENYGSKLYSVKWSPTGNYIAIGGQEANDGHDALEVYAFDGTSLNFSCSVCFGGFSTSFISCLEWSSNGSYIAVTGDTGEFSSKELTVYLFENEILTETSSINYGGPGNRGYSVSWSPDGQYVAIGGKPNIRHEEIEVYSVLGGELSSTPISSINYGSYGTSYVTSVSWSPDGNYLAVSGVNPGISHKNVEVFGFDGSELSILLASKTDYQLHSDFDSIVNEVKWHSSGEYLSVVGVGNPDIHIYTFDVDPLGDILGKTTFGHEVRSCDWSPDDQYLVVAGYEPSNLANEEVQVYNLPVTPGDDLIYIAGYDYATGTDKEAEVVCWSPDGNYLAIGGKHGGQDNRVAVCEFDVAASPTITLKDNAYDNFDRVYTLTWSPNGIYLAVGGLNSGTDDVYIYSFAGDLLTTVTCAPFGSEVYELKWSPDGNYIVAVGWDGLRNKQCKIYGFDSVAETINLAAEEEVASTVMSVDWSSNGYYLAMGYYSLFVYYWDGSTLTQKYNESAPYRIHSIRWSNECDYLSVGGEDLSGSGEDFKIYQFDPLTENFYPSYQTRLYDPEPIYSIAWKSDDNTFAIAGDGGYAVKVYEFNGNVLDENVDFDFYLSDSWAVADISPDGKYMALNYGGLRLYDVQNTATPTLISETNLTVNSNDIKWSPNGSYLVNVASDEKIYLHEFSNEAFELKDTYATSGDDLFCVDWSPDGRHVAAGIFGGSSENIITFSISNDDLHVTFSVDCCNSDNGIYSVHWTSSGSYLAVGGRSLNVNPTTTHDIRIYKFDSTSTESLAYISGSVLSTSTIRSVNWNPDNIYLAAGGEDSVLTGCLHLFKFNSVNSSLSLLQTLSVDSGVSDICWDDAGRYLVVTKFDYTFEIYNLNRISQQLELISDTQTTFGGTRKPQVKWFLDGHHFVVSGKNFSDGNDVNIYNFSGMPLQQVSEINLNYGIAAWATKWHPTKNYLAVGGSAPTDGKELKVYKFDENKTLTLLHGCNIDCGIILSIDWSPDGNLLAAGLQSPTNDHEVQIYRFNKQNSLCLTTSANYGDRVYSVAWSPDGNNLAVGGYIPSDGAELHIYAINEQDYLYRVTGADYGSNSLARILELDWSPDGNYLALAGGTPENGNELQIYSFDSTTSTLSCLDGKDFGAGGSYEAWTVAWSPDGNYVAAGGEDDGRLKIYSFAGGSLSDAAIVDESLGAGNIYTLAWSPCGKYLVVSPVSPTNGHETQVYLFDGVSISLVTSIDYGAGGSAQLCFDWSSDGKWIAAGGQDPNDEKEIKVYSVDWAYDETPETSDVQSTVEIENSTIEISQNLTLENMNFKAK